MSRERQRRELRERLRAWDPLREHPLSPDRTQRMRERLKKALDDKAPVPGAPPEGVDRPPSGSLIRPGSSLWEPRWLAIAVGLALLVAGAFWWLGSGDGPSPVPAPSPRIDEVPSDIAATPADEAVAAASEPPAVETAAVRPPVVSPGPEPRQEAASGAPIVAPASSRRGSTAASAAASATPRPARRLQFQSPRGTRIYWTLDPDFDASFASRATGAGE